jgi:hypothetical protein
MFKCVKTVINNENVFNIHWINKPVNINIYEKIVRWVRRSTDYSNFNKKKQKKFFNLLNEFNNDKDVSLDQALSIRNIALKDKLISNHVRMNSNISNISRLYDNYDIIKLSRSFDFPPLNLLKGIFLFRGYNSSEIYDVFGGRLDVKKVLRGRDLSQFHLALKNDAECYIDQKKNAEIAAKNEEKFIELFVNLGIKLKTQAELSEEQVKKYGRAVNTPDLLFLDIVYINDKLTKWIDFKDYLGTNIKFLYKSNSNQTTRYVAEWGPGALCYSYGFVENLMFYSTQLLDGNSLPIEFI